MEVLPVWFEITSMAVLIGILLFDLLYIVKRPHVPSMKEATGWVVFYVALALLFAGSMFWVGDPEHGSQFLAGWLTEYSLSIDNLFVFVIIMSRFAVPRELQQRVLMIGIIIAVVLRGIFILIGAQLIESFSAIFYLFGAFLVWTAWKQAFGGDDDEGEKDNLVVRLLRKRVNLSDHYDGGKLRTRIDGTTFFTPMLIVILALGSTDLLFAIDSIPAIFGISTDPFIVFACNIFALMGLRQLYFLLGGLLDRLVYLHYGIAFILAFIGVKLVAHAMHVNELPFINGGQHIEWAPEISTWTSLIVIVASMAVATIASLVKMRVDARKTGDTSLHLGPAEAEIGADGHFHLVDAVGTSFSRPVRVEPRTAGLTVVAADGAEQLAKNFDREELRAAAREDMTAEQIEDIRPHVRREFGDEAPRD